MAWYYSLNQRDARLLLFCVSVFWVLITPGPGVLSLAGVGSTFGLSTGWNYGIGLFVGSNLVMLASALGLGALLLAHPPLRIGFMIVSCSYLFYLALRIALTGSRIAFIELAKPPGFKGSIVFQIFNPKAYAVGTFVFSNFPFWPESLFLEGLVKFALLNAIWIPIHILWLFAGVTLRTLNLSQTIQISINVAMAIAIVAAVLVALTAGGLL